MIKIKNFTRKWPSEVTNIKSNTVLISLSTFLCAGSWWEEKGSHVKSMRLVDRHALGVAADKSGDQTGVPGRPARHKKDQQVVLGLIPSRARTPVPSEFACTEDTATWIPRRVTPVISTWWTLPSRLRPSTGLPAPAPAAATTVPRRTSEVRAVTSAVPRPVSHRWCWGRGAWPPTPERGDGCKIWTRRLTGWGCSCRKLARIGSCPSTRPCKWPRRTSWRCTTSWRRGRNAGVVEPWSRGVPELRISEVRSPQKPRCTYPCSTLKYRRSMKISDQHITDFGLYRNWLFCQS